MNKISKPLRALNYIYFILFAIITFYPFWYTLIASIIPFSEYSRKILLLWPDTLTFEAYSTILRKGSDVVMTLGVSIFTTVVGSALSMIMTVMAAYLLTKKQMPGHKIFSSLMLITMLFSGELIPTYIALNSCKLIDSIWVYILPGLINAFYALIIKTAFQELPPSLEEAARIDGCSEMRSLFTIILPVSLPTLALSLFLCR